MIDDIAGMTTLIKDIRQNVGTTSSFLCMPVFQLHEFREFSRIEKRASAGRAFFVLDVRLLWIYSAQHTAIASGTTIAVDFIRLPAC